MKKLTPFAFTLFLTMILVLPSCEKEDEPEPETSGTTDPRAKFHGHWYNSEISSANGSSTYYVEIGDSSNASYILFAGLYGYQAKVYATINTNSLTIPEQIVEGNKVSGSGTLVNSNQISLSYLVWLGGSNYDTVRSTLTK
jgi:hypothetical protein